MSADRPAVESECERCGEFGPVETLQTEPTTRDYPGAWAPFCRACLDELEDGAIEAAERRAEARAERYAYDW